MDLDKLIRAAVERIRDEFGLPSSGFIAGGAIANIVWELVSGKRAIINDVDVFIFNGLATASTSQESLYLYQEKEQVITDGYYGHRFSSITKEFYSIERTEHDGIFNNVWYKSNKADTDIILRSFDINCTKVGYSIDEDKSYWTEDFKDFLNTGELKVCNLMTPSHTAVRIVKKSKELACNLDQFEIEILKWVLYHNKDHRAFSDIARRNFMERYLALYEKYYDVLGEHFVIERDLYSEDYVKTNFQKEVKLYHLVPTVEESYLELETLKNCTGINSTVEFLFYIRNIWGNQRLSEIWSKIFFFFVDKDYVDCNASEEDLDLLRRLASYAPRTVVLLSGKKLSEQIDIVKWILGKFESDPIIAIAILEKHNISKDLDDLDLLLLELSVRKNIHNEGKAKNILGSLVGEFHINQNMDI